LATLVCTTLAIPLFACGGSGHLGGESAGSSTRFTAFSGSTIDGKRLDVRPHLGRDVLFVSFWATWCEPCKAEMPVLQSFHERYAKDGLAVVSVSIDGPDTAADVAPYVRRHGYTFPVVLDDDGAIAQRHNPNSTAPYTILVARDGTVRRRIAGFQPSEAPELERELRHLLGLEPQ
jgi:thiol-disulfide isomerase/thioredoxin